MCKITAEAQKRGESFKSELDFVFANVVRCWRAQTIAHSCGVTISTMASAAVTQRWQLEPRADTDASIGCFLLPSLKGNSFAYLAVSWQQQAHSEICPDAVSTVQVMALIADFMLVWLPAPTLSYAAKKAGKQGKLASFLASCPDNAFQVRMTRRGLFEP